HSRSIHTQAWNGTSFPRCKAISLFQPSCTLTLVTLSLSLSLSVSLSLSLSHCLFLSLSVLFSFFWLCRKDNSLLMQTAVSGASLFLNTHTHTIHTQTPPHHTT